MANEKIEDVIKKVILGEGFLAENAEEQDTPESEDTSDEDAIAEEEVYEDGEEIVEEELEEAKDEESEEEEEEDEEEEEEEEDEEDSKGKKKMPAFLKGKFGKKKEKVEEAASDYASDKMYKTANGKTAQIAEPTGDNSGKNMATIKPKPSAAKAEAKYPSLKKEDIAAMFNGQELSEEFKSQAATLFEAHLNERVHQIEEQLKAQYEDLLEQHTVAVTEELVERIDDYLNYVVEEWMQENRLAVEKGIRTEVAEQFIEGLRSLFLEHNIEVPTAKVDLVDEMAEKVEALTNDLNEQILKNVEVSKQVAELRRKDILDENCDGLAETQKERMKKLAEGVAFEGEEDYRSKLEIIRESYFGAGATESQNEETAEEETVLSENIGDDMSGADAPSQDRQEELSESMSVYAKALSRLNRR